MSFSRPGCPFDLGAVDFEAQPVIDWIESERRTRRDLNLGERPLILIGANAVLAQPFVVAAKASLNVVAVLDNVLPADAASRPMIIGDGELDLALKAYPDAAGVLCCGSENALRHFRRLWGQRPQPLLFYFEVIAALDMASHSLRLDFMRSFQSLEAAQAARRMARRYLADTPSLKTLDGVLLHRLTWDLSLLDAVSRPEKAVYFEDDVMPLTPDEVFVDGGAYDGDTVRQFLAASGGHYREIHAFELDPVNAAVLADRTHDVARLTTYPVGLWSARAQLALDSGDNGSRVSAEGDRRVDLVALDDLDITAPTLIKLDVEGAEIEVLRGAAKLIAKHKPRLAICAYHKADDLVTLFDAVRAIRDDYQFHLRHYSPIVFDTVIYAT